MIDVNATRFHVLLNERDWRSGGSVEAGDVRWNEAKAAVTLRPLLLRFPEPRSTHLLDLSRRRGADRDRYGNWYTIDPNESGIVVLGSGWSKAESFWPGPAAPCPPPAKADGGFGPADATPPARRWRLRGLTVTCHHYLVVGVLAPFVGLLVFDLHGGGAPEEVRWSDDPASAAASLPEGGGFAPLDLAARPDGGVWILDRPVGDDASEHARLWALDRHFRLERAHREETPPIADDFKPVGGAPRLAGARVRNEGAPVTCPPETAPAVAIEALPDDTVLLLTVHADTGATAVSRYRTGQWLATSVRIDELLHAEWQAGADVDGGAPPPWRGHDFAFVPGETRPGTTTGTLFVVGADGNQAVALAVTARDADITLRLQPTFYPLRRFSGSGIVAADDTVHYDLGERWLPLVAQPRPSYMEEGTIETSLDAPLDAEPDCVWHRLVLDGRIPPGTTVRVQSRAANDPDRLAETPWDDEPALYRRATGAEVAYHRPFDPEVPHPPGTGVWELLFQRATGRYLQLRFTLSGGGRSTPRIQAARIHFPRFSYLREYLPDVYAADTTSASFLDRFLANVEGSFTTLEGRIAEVQHLLDPRLAGVEYLDWLASWMGVVLDPAWDAAKRRLFLEHADTMFRQRGTVAGLARAVRLAIDPCPDETLFEPDAVAADIGAPPSCGATSAYDPFGVRFVESFLTRDRPGIVYGDPTDTIAPGLTSEAEAWTPAIGSARLHEQFGAFLDARYGGDATALADAWGQPGLTFATVRLAPVLPAHDGARADWTDFVAEEIGFTYAIPAAADETVWQDFLRHRYRSIETLNGAHVRDYDTFGDVGLPAESAFPSGGPLLVDWITFVSKALPLRRSAHRFTVLVPTEPGSGEVEQAARLALVQRVIDAEKPAHTSFEIKPYWAAFQVGSARLGYDTLLDEGSRYVAVLLGQTHLARGYVAREHPWNVHDRFVVERDNADSDRTL